MTHMSSPPHMFGGCVRTPRSRAVFLPSKEARPAPFDRLPKIA
jgi:hypothetical protein